MVEHLDVEPHRRQPQPRVLGPSQTVESRARSVAARVLAPRGVEVEIGRVAAESLRVADLLGETRVVGERSAPVDADGGEADRETRDAGIALRPGNVDTPE